MKHILIIIAGLLGAQGMFAGAFKLQNLTDGKISLTMRDNSNQDLFRGDLAANGQSDLLQGDNFTYISFRNWATNEQCRAEVLKQRPTPREIGTGRNLITINSSEFNNNKFYTYKHIIGGKLMGSGDFTCEKIKPKTK